DQNRLAQWSDTLSFLAQVYADPQMQAALANPDLTKESAATLLLTTASDRVDDAARNLVLLMARNDRLSVLPQTAALYDELREKHENKVEAAIQSAYALDDAQLKNLVARLEQKTGHKVDASVAIVPELIGGVRVQIGDDVWDASVRGQLDAMTAALAS
ncbi:MAG: F0F1 ATP synthase subunit delta, partial [Betaproteobacteria bacterium]